MLWIFVLAGIVWLIARSHEQRRRLDELETQLGLLREREIRRARAAGTPKAGTAQPASRDTTTSATDDVIQLDTPDELPPSDKAAATSPQPLPDSPADNAATSRPAPESASRATADAASAQPRPETRQAHQTTQRVSTPPMHAATPATPEQASPPGGAATPPRTPEVEQGDAPGASFERTVGTRLFVWIAAVALAFAGIYLVKYSFDNNILNPTVRLTLAGVFGVVLLGVGEWFVRRDRRIAAALNSAGVAVLFATLLAGVQYEKLIAPSIGFVLMAIVAAAAVALSLRHGALVAVLGMIGGFATPMMVGPREQPPQVLFGYLLLLDIGLIMVTRVRGWWWLTVLTLLASYGWAGAWMLLRPDSDAGVYLGLFLVASAAAFAFSLGRAQENIPHVWRIVLRSDGMVMGILIAAWLLRAQDYGNTQWMFLGILSLACIAQARLRIETTYLSWFGVLMCVAMLAAWRHDAVGPDAAMWFALVCLIFGVVHVAVTYACMWRHTHAAAAAWAWLAGVAGVLYLLLAHGAEPGVPFERFWGALCIALAGLYALGGWGAVRMRQARAGLDAMAFTAATFVTLAVAIELEQQWVAVGYALVLAGIATVHLCLPLLSLRAAACILTALIALRLLADGAIDDYAIAATPVWNWLLYGYGLPIAAFAFAAWAFDRRLGEADYLTRLCEGGALVLTWALATLLVRHGFAESTVGWFSGPMRFIEAHTMAGVWMALAVGVLALRFVLRRTVIDVAHQAALLGGMIVLVCAVFFFTPLLHVVDVRSSLVINELTYAYGLPLVLAAAGAVLARRLRDTQAMQVYAVAAMVLTLVLVTMLIRHAFNPDDMRSSAMTDVRTSLVEWATYPVAWLVLAAALLFVPQRAARKGATHAAALIVAGAATFALLTLGLMQNPLWTAHTLGDARIWNELLYAFGLPCALLFVVAHLLRSRVPAPWARWTVTCAIALCFALISVQVRHYFHGPEMRLLQNAPNAVLGLRTIGVASAENYTYSTAWIVLATVLLVVGVALKSPALRWGSLVIMLLSVGKVFLLDMSQLRDLWRVLSFLGLGVTLLVLAMIYQRYVFAATVGAAGDKQQGQGGAA